MSVPTIGFELRLTAAKYLDQLADAGFVSKHKTGRYNYYINEPLLALFLD